MKVYITVVLILLAIAGLSFGLISFSPDLVQTLALRDRVVTTDNGTEITVEDRNHFIQVAHRYTNHLWCNDNGTWLPGTQEEVFQALQRRWKEFEFNTPDEIKLYEYVLSHLIIGETASPGATARRVHRAFHDLDYHIFGDGRGQLYNVTPFDQRQFASLR